MVHVVDKDLILLSSSRRRRCWSLQGYVLNTTQNYNNIIMHNIAKNIFSREPQRFNDNSIYGSISNKPTGDCDGGVDFRR